MSFGPKRTKYLGTFVVDPTPTESGQWWHNTTDGAFKFNNGTATAILGGYYTKTVSISSDEFGRPNVNPPTIVEQGNIILYSFTVDTDKIFFKYPIPSDYAEGSLDFFAVWTNDGGVDDNGKNVKWQIDYQVAAEGDPVDGSHANSPKTIDDAYIGATGWIEHHTGVMSIAQADFDGKLCLYIRLMAITALPTILTCDPHLVGVCLSYSAQRMPM